jgi:A118 family predicted phage portal protein
MPDISVKQKVQTMDRFRDITWYYRYLGKCIYRGYVPFETVTGWNNNELSRYANFHEFQRKGTLWQRKTINLPYAITNYFIRSMYAETPVIESGKTDTDKLLAILNDNKFFIREKNLQATKLNIGDYVLKPYVLDGKVKIDYITGDIFVSTKIVNNETIDGIFLTEKVVVEKKQKIYYRRLEWHYEVENRNELGVLISKHREVKWELYKSKNLERLGDLCNLDKFRTIFGELLEEDTETYLDLDIPTFVLGINPDQNNKDTTCGRGLGIFMNTLDTIQSADEGFHAKSTDNVYGSMQKLTHESSMQMQGYEVGGEIVYSKHVDPRDPDIYIYGGENIADSKPDAYAPTLRTEQHVASINVDVDITAVNLGITAGTLRFDGKSMVTATQVINEKSDSAKTIREVERNTGEDWKRLFMLIKYFANKFGNEDFTYEYTDLKIEWKDNIIADDETEKEFDKWLMENGLVPQYKFLTKYQDVDEAQAKMLIKEATQERNEIYSDDETDDNQDDDIEDNIIKTLNGSDDKEQVDSSYNGAQIQSAIQIIKEFATGALSEESAVVMLMEFLRVDEELAKKMLIVDKSKIVIDKE